MPEPREFAGPVPRSSPALAVGFSVERNLAEDPRDAPPVGLVWKNRVLPAGFEPASEARKAPILDRTRLRERGRVSPEVHKCFCGRVRVGPETTCRLPPSTNSHAPSVAPDDGERLPDLRVAHRSPRLGCGPLWRARGGRQPQRREPLPPHLHHDVRRGLREHRGGFRELLEDADGPRPHKALPRRLPVPRGRIPPPVRVQRPPRGTFLGGVLRDRLDAPARRGLPDPIHEAGARLRVARPDRVPDCRIRRHEDGCRVAHRDRGGSGPARPLVEGGRGGHRNHPRLPHAWATRRTDDGERRRESRPLTRHISPATSFARSLYSCSFIAAGFAEINRYESFSTTFSLTFWRKRITDANPF